MLVIKAPFVGTVRSRDLLLVLVPIGFSCARRPRNPQECLTKFNTKWAVPEFSILVQEYSTARLQPPCKAPYKAHNAISAKFGELVVFKLPNVTSSNITAC